MNRITSHPLGGKTLKKTEEEEKSPERKDTTPLVFADPESIAKRGRIPNRKYRKLPKARTQTKPIPGYPIWIVRDGEPVKMHCTSCQSGLWKELGRDGMFTDVQCSIGHEARFLTGFYTEKPFETEEKVIAPAAPQINIKPLDAVVKFTVIHQAQARMMLNVPHCPDAELFRQKKPVRMKLEGAGWSSSWIPFVRMDKMDIQPRSSKPFGLAVVFRAVFRVADWPGVAKLRSRLRPQRVRLWMERIHQELFHEEQEDAPIGAFINARRAKRNVTPAGRQNLKRKTSRG